MSLDFARWLRGEGKFSGSIVLVSKGLRYSKVKKELDRLDFRMYDIDIDVEMKRKYNITKVPTTIFQCRLYKLFYKLV